MNSAAGCIQKFAVYLAADLISIEPLKPAAGIVISVIFHVFEVSELRMHFKIEDFKFVDLTSPPNSKVAHYEEEVSGVISIFEPFPKN